MIPIIPYIPPQQRGQKPNSLALLSGTFLLLSLVLAFIGFMFFNGMSFDIAFVILGIIILIASFIPLIVALESKQSKSKIERPMRSVSRPYQLVQQTWDHHSQTKHEYCVNCGSVVDSSDFFCVTCGTRLN